MAPLLARLSLPHTPFSQSPLFDGSRESLGTDTTALLLNVEPLRSPPPDFPNMHSLALLDCPIGWIERRGTDRDRIDRRQRNCRRRHSDVVELLA